MSTDLVFWSGPVAEFQVPDATIDGAERFFLNCRGDKGPHPHCPTIGAQIDRSLDSLLARSPVSRRELGDLIVGAFSAGGSIVKRLMVNSEYRDATTAVYLCDAAWTAAWADAQNRIPPPDEGFVKYAVDVAQGPGDKLFIATFSPNPNGQWATGHENMESIKAEVERRTGQKFVLRPRMPGGIEPPTAEEVWQLGNVIFAKYPSAPLGHNHPKIAGDIFRGVIQPWLDKGKGPIDSPEGLPAPPPPLPGAPPPSEGLDFEDVLLFSGAALASFLTVRWLSRS